MCVRVLASFLQDGEGAAQEELPDWIEEEKKDFKERLDKNGDNVLDHDEIREWVAPTETAFRKEEVEHLFKHADVNTVWTHAHKHTYIACTHSHGQHTQPSFSHFI